MKLEDIKPVVTLGRFPKGIPTLGWEFVKFSRMLSHPKNSAEPLALTKEQINFALWFYALKESVNPDTGEKYWRFTYRRACLRRAKTWGKSPFVGAILLFELLGNCRLSHFDANGIPVGMQEPVPWVVIGGASETQTENTMMAVRVMCQSQTLKNAFPELDAGMTRILYKNGKLVSITTNPASQEGGRWTFAAIDESHHLLKSNGGHALWDVVMRNTGSKDARILETTNTPQPGMNSVAERTYKAWRAQVEKRAKNQDILYDSRSAPDDIDLTDEKQLRAGLKCAYGDSWWVNIENIVRTIQDPDHDIDQSRRFYLNLLVKAQGGWVHPSKWAGCEQRDLAPLRLNELAITKVVKGRSVVTKPATLGDAVTLGFDGSLTDDSTALVACRVEDGSVWVVGVWEKPEGPDGKGWEVPKSRVRDAVAWAFAHLNVLAFFADRAYWETENDDWANEYSERLLIKATTKHPISFDMRGNGLELTRAVEATKGAITEGTVPWCDHVVLTDDPETGRSGSEILSRHVANCRRAPNRYGATVSKESRESPLKIDVAVTMILARLARQRLLADGSYRKHLQKKPKAPARLYGFH